MFDTGRFCSPVVDMCDSAGDDSRCAYFVEASGLLTFDNVGYAGLIILQTITFDTWTEAMYAVMDAVSGLAFIYFVLIAVLGGLFVVNLFLAVIFDEFMTALAVSATPAV